MNFAQNLKCGGQKLPIRGIINVIPCNEPLKAFNR